MTTQPLVQARNTSPVISPPLKGTPRGLDGLRVLLRTRDFAPLGRGSVIAFEGELGLPAWRATVGHLELGGRIATAYFQDGVRDVIVELPDGRVLDALLRDTSIVHGVERVCELAGR